MGLPSNWCWSVCKKEPDAVVNPPIIPCCNWAHLPNLLCTRRCKQFGIFVGGSRELFEGIGNKSLALGATSEACIMLVEYGRELKVLAIFSCDYVRS